MDFNTIIETITTLFADFDIAAVLQGILDLVMGLFAA